MMEWTLSMGGGGGLVGSVQNGVWHSVNDGYATVGTDTGHQGGGTDGRWALDDLEAFVNFGHVAVHRTSEVSKAIIRACYGKDPEKILFRGLFARRRTSDDGSATIPRGFRRHCRGRARV